MDYRNGADACSLHQCNDCGMTVEPNEFHPYAACLMFKSCHDGEVVRKNLTAIRDASIEYCAMILDAADKNDHPSDLAERLRGLKET